jgi:HAD superfamily hydrolase (TIGR01549 family)
MTLRIDESTGGIRRFQNVEAVLFDLDKTLIHVTGRGVWGFLDEAGRAVHEWLYRQGRVSADPSRYIRRMRTALLRSLLWSRIRRREVHLPAVFRRVHCGLGLDWYESDEIDLAARMAPAFRRYYAPDPRALSVLQTLHRSGVRMGLVSNTMLPRSVIDDCLEAIGLIGFLPVRVLSSETGFKKPDPRIFQLALTQLSASADKTVFVGDRMDNDILGASRVGMGTVLLRPGSPDPRRTRGADCVVQSLAVLPSLLGCGSAGETEDGPTRDSLGAARAG